MNIKDEQKKQSPQKEITRKEALKKAGKYAGFTAAGMLMVLSPKESQAESPSSSPRAPREWR